MSLEGRHFRVPEEVTTAVLDEAGSYEETLEYAKGILARAREKHPTLYGYLASTAKQQGDFWYSYGICSALSYDIASRHAARQGNQDDFTDEEVKRHSAIADSIFDDPRWQDEKWVLERVNTEDGTDVDSGLGLFFNTLDSNAPELSSAIADFTNQIDIPANRRHTLRGFYDGFMPFYTRAVVRSEQGI